MSLRKNISPAQNVQVRLLGAFDPVWKAMAHERCSNFAKEVIVRINERLRFSPMAPLFFYP